MKIQSNSMEQAVNRLVQEDSNTSQTPKSLKQILPDAQNFQLSGQFADTVKSEQSMIAKNRAVELHATFGDKKLGQLRQQLGDLKNEKQGLISQIVATSQKLAGAQLANDQTGIADASAQLEELKGALGQVEVKIKAVLQEIEKLGQQEQEEQDKIQSNLSKTADSYSQLAKNIIDP